MTAHIPHILVVDDAEATRYLMSSWLRRNGYTVTEVGTGEEALSVLEHTRPDAVLLDVHLPDISGFEVCERIKQDPRTAALPVIHVSATAIEVEDKEQGLTRGADAYLVEPVDPRELVATLEAVLRYYRARAQAEQLAQQLARLTELTFRIHSADTFDDVLAISARGAAELFGATATVSTTSPTAHVRTAASGPGEAEATLRTEPANTAPPAHDMDLNVTSSGTTTAAVVRPKPSRTPVRITVQADTALIEQDRNVLVQLTQSTALACEGLRALTQEHALALTLQRSLLPRSLPESPAVAMAARYVPASAHAEIGGDFYEVTELEGRLLVAIGDVAGHSLAAATVMGEVRHALRAYAVEGHGPVAILDRLDTMIHHFHPRDLTTLCLMVLDPETGATEIANAGHIPPLVATATSKGYIDVRGPLLGVRLPRPASTHMTLARGDLALLVTDGLIESRAHNIDYGMDALLASVTHDDDLEALSDRLLESLGHNAEDDIALLALRRS